MAKKKWIQDAIKRPGDLSSKAKKAGKSVSEYCSDTSGMDDRTVKQCNLFHILKKMASKHGKEKDS